MKQIKMFKDKNKDKSLLAKRRLLPIHSSWKSRDSVQLGRQLEHGQVQESKLSYSSKNFIYWLILSREIVWVNSSSKVDSFCMSCPSSCKCASEASKFLISVDYVYFLVDFLGSARIRVERVFWVVLLCLREEGIVLFYILSDDGLYQLQGLKFREYFNWGLSIFHLLDQAQTTFSSVIQSGVSLKLFESSCRFLYPSQYLLS